MYQVLSLPGCLGQGAPLGNNTHLEMRNSAITGFFHVPTHRQITGMYNSGPQPNITTDFLFKCLSSVAYDINLIPPHFQCAHSDCSVGTWAEAVLHQLPQALTSICTYTCWAENRRTLQHYHEEHYVKTASCKWLLNTHFSAVGFAVLRHGHSITPKTGTLS